MIKIIKAKIQRLLYRINSGNYEDYSIDRIDSNLGYIEGNIVITTNRVNVAKNDITTEEFKKINF